MARNPVLAILTVLLLTLALAPGAVPTAGATAPQGAAPAAKDGAKTLPLVVVVSTGGTIAEKTDPKTGGAVPTVSGDDLIAAVPGLAALARIEVVNYSNIDSSQMTPERWAGLSRAVDAALARPEVAGVVVTHGTDTMAEGSFFLDATLTSDKPVVFTGAMNDASSPFPDGPGNLYNAVLQVCSPASRDWGVTVTLNGYINSARDVRKTQTTNVQTFESGEKGYLGYITSGTVSRFNDRLRRVRLPLPETLPKVAFLATYAGDDGAFVRHAVNDGAKGIVIDGVGSGNVNEAVYGAVKDALSKGVVVAISTTVYYGSVEPVYGDLGGGLMLEKDGCILAGDLPGQKARLLLMLGLAGYGPDAARLKALFSF
jgi:L-asparaginase